MTLYKNKYRVESTRLKYWDYSSDGHYYITICTDKSMHYFGKVINHVMNLSEIGNMTYQYWLEIPEHFPFVRLRDFVVMPNHVHGIIIIEKNVSDIPNVPISVNVETQNSVETQNLASLQPIQLQQLQYSQYKSQQFGKFGPQSKNIASIIRGFKIGVTKYARNNDIQFKWQSRFYDHIIQNNEDLERINNYIKDNPKNWIEDEYYM